MARAKPKTEGGKRPAAGSEPLINGAAAEVMTLGETAAYLRLPEETVLRLVREAGLPGRQIGPDWRLFKRAVQAWLSKPLAQVNDPGIWAYAGVWKDDPYADELLEAIWRQRGRPVPEE